MMLVFEVKQPQVTSGPPAIYGNICPSTKFQCSYTLEALPIIIQVHISHLDIHLQTLPHPPLQILPPPLLACPLPPLPSHPLPPLLSRQLHLHFLRHCSQVAIIPFSPAFSEVGVSSFFCQTVFSSAPLPAF